MSASRSFSLLHWWVGAVGGVSCRVFKVMTGCKINKETGSRCREDKQVKSFHDFFET